MFDLHTDKLYFTFVFKYRTRVTHKSMQRHSSLWTRTRSSSLDNDRIASTIDAKDCYWLRCSISFSHILQQTFQGINSTWTEIIQPLSDIMFIDSTNPPPPPPPSCQLQSNPYDSAAPPWSPFAHFAMLFAIAISSMNAPVLSQYLLPNDTRSWTAPSALYETTERIQRCLLQKVDSS